MSRQQPTFALSVLLLFCLSLVFLFLVQLHGKSAGAPTSGAAQDEQNPFALIKTVVVNGPGPNEATVVHGGQRSVAQTGMMLYVGDEVDTGPNVKLTILFLDNAAEKDNEVFIDASTHVQLGSLFTWAGRILASVKGAFETKTERGRWSVQGTEYELVVKADGTNTLQVLKGAVQVETGSFSPTVAEHSGEGDQSESAPMFMRAAFRAPEELSQQNEMDFVAVSGKVITVEREFIFTNRCQHRHLYKISTPLNLPWFQFLGADQFAIETKGTRTIKFAIKLDGTNVPVGTLNSQIVAPCVDCNQETGCEIGGLLLPITVKVIENQSGSTAGRATPSPTTTGPTTPPLTDSAVASRMQQISLPPGGKLLRSNAAAPQIDQTLNWSNEVIIPGEPTYSAQSVVPRYQTWEERNRVFREARRSSILTDDSRSKETLADVYIEWGNGAKAEQELKGLSQASPDRLTSLGEAYRLMGDLTTAERLLKQATGLDPNWAPALNALGNVYLDQAKAAQDQKDDGRARDYLQKAKQAYTQALAAQPAPSSDKRNHSGRQQMAASPGQTATVVRSNLGEVNLRMGQIAKKEGRTDEALGLYQLAEQEFGNAAKVAPNYQFAFTGLGDVYRETGETFGSLGDKAKANQYFTRSQDHYSRAVKLHNDMAEAYVGLGKVLDDKGQHGEALNQYFKATQVRPDLAEPHYHLAVALASVDPRKAAEQARSFLKIERQPLKQGEKGNNARLVMDHRPVPVQTVTPGVGSTDRQNTSPSPSPTPTPSPSPSPTTVRVPHVNGDTPEQALKKLKKRGLKGEIREQGDCIANGRVLSTNPARDQSVAQGTVVTVFISGAGENALMVPPVTKIQLTDAEGELRRVGLEPRVSERVENNSVAENTVLEQNPLAESRLMRGCTVELKIAIPVRLIRVPSYLGLRQVQALGRLPKISGDLIRGSVTEVDSDQPAGRVIDQSPPPGAMVRPGTYVDLIISRGHQVPEPVLVEVPLVVGMSPSAATAKIKAAGLVPVVKGHGDVVDSQDPNPSKKRFVQRGSSVTLNLAGSLR